LKKVAPTLVPTFNSWQFKAEAALEDRPQSTNDIVIDFSSFNYKVTYKYDRVNNVYARYQGDSPHITKDGTQILAKDIVVEYTKTVATNDEKKRLDIDTTGQGKLLMFRDGTVTTGTWKKDSPSSRTEFLDANNQPL